jgi:tRNA-specific 2-thiouridylase
MNTNENKPVVIAMSGGVDSSLAAALLQERQPGAVVGFTMQLWDQTRLQKQNGNGSALPIVHAGRCCSLDDAYDARRVAEHLGFPFYVVNFEQKFEATVVRPFVESYLAGETPIPCTLCNNSVKFEHLLTMAQQVGADRVATGHYCRVRFNQASGRYELLRARDRSKDQTYFLFGLQQEQLARTEFPLGEMTKQEVRRLAEERDLPVAQKAESQEICFVPSGNYSDFIDSYMEEQGGVPPNEAGEIVTTDGEVLGTHDGIHRFTVGQRRGLGLAAGKPLYVVSIDKETNRVIVGNDEELHHREAQAREVNWVSIAPPAGPVRAMVRVRNKHEPAAATVTPTGDSDERGVRIVFDEPQRAVTPGQAAVFYAAADAPEPDLVLGGGWITETRE